MRNYTLDHEDATEIKNLMLGRIIVSVQGDSLTLDNGTELRILPNEGCGGCSNGHYQLDFLKQVDNVITDVKFNEEFVDERPYDFPTIYSIYVYTDSMTTAIPLAEISGNDGNGYYGTGYRINVTVEE